MPTSTEEAKAPREASVLESRFVVTENHLVRAHSIVDRMMPRETCKVEEDAAGLVATANRINEELTNLCDRLDGVAERVGLL